MVLYREALDRLCVRLNMYLVKKHFNVKNKPAGRLCSFALTVKYIWILIVIRRKALCHTAAVYARRVSLKKFYLLKQLLLPTFLKFCPTRCLSEMYNFKFCF